MYEFGFIDLVSIVESKNVRVLREKKYDFEY